MEYTKLPCLICLCISVISSQRTTIPIEERCCLRPVEKTVNYYYYENVTMDADCETMCNRKKENCVDVYWANESPSASLRNDSNKCWLKMTVSKNTGRWNLSNCEADNTSYCWKLKTDVSIPGGDLRREFTNETSCKQACINNITCTGVDWNINTTQCWILQSHHDNAAKTIPQVIHHWKIEKNLPRTIQVLGYAETIWNIVTTNETTTEKCSNSSTITEKICNKQDTFSTREMVLAALLGIWTLIIIGISICAVRIKKHSSTHKVFDEAMVDGVEKVKEEKVDNIYETKEGDDESYIDYQDLRRPNNPNTYEEQCEYTAMELENMKHIEDDDDVYCNDNQ